MTPRLPSGWNLAASAFNWTPDVVRAAKESTEISLDIVRGSIAHRIEIEPGQLWRSYPEPAIAELESFRDELSRAGGAVSIVGASMDDWASPTRRRTPSERLAFLIPQIRAAHTVGASGLRLPIGAAGEDLLRAVQPLLDELDLVLYEEIQGQQTPDAPGTAAAIATISQLDDPHIRLLLDISMLMPSLPPSYLDLLRRGGVPRELLDRLEGDWTDPATNSAVMDLLRSGGVPDEVHTAYMNLIVRFGRSRASDLRGVLPLVGAVHLKFWDLDDTEDRVTQPIREIARELVGVGFAGTLCSEWGGHEWLDADPTDMTEQHLLLAGAALATSTRGNA